MTTRPKRVKVLQLALLLTAVFDLLALLVLVRTTPIGFALFMFIGQPLFVLALVALAGAVVAELRSKDLI